MNKTRQMILIKKSIITLLAVLMTSPVLSQPWYHPREGVDSAFLQNTSDEPVTLWLTGPSMNGQFLEEESIDLAPKESKKIDLSSLPAWPYFTFKSYRNIPVKIFLQENQHVFSLPVGRSDTLVLNLKASFNRSLEPAQLTLSNMIPFGQDGRIRIFNFLNQEKVVSFSLNAHESKQIPIQISGATKIQIEGNYPLTAHLSQSNIEVPAIPVRSVASLKPKKEGSYFLMSNPDHTQSFVFNTTNEVIVEEARAQIQGTKYKRTFVGRVQMGHGNMNRDLHSPLKALWSWSVAEAYGFADLTSQDCDGSPQIVEDALSWWMNQPRPNICFWNYKIEKELSVQDLTDVDAP